MPVLPFKVIALFCLTLLLSLAGGAFPEKPLSVSSQQGIELGRETLALRAEAATTAATSLSNYQVSEQSKQAAPVVAPAVKVSYRYYPISGSSAAQLRSQMRQHGPFEPLEGRRYDARTEWLVQWSYRYSRSNNQCRVGALATKADVTITYPRWAPTASAPRSLIVDWQRYMTALQTHENGHKDNGVAAARDILSALNQLPAYPSCEALDREASAISQSIIRRYNQRDLDYDHNTNHGYSQGAVFPAIARASQ
jgi:predicted secreted Zn-dependent protease